MASSLSKASSSILSEEFTSVLEEHRSLSLTVLSPESRSYSEDEMIAPAISYHMPDGFYLCVNFDISSESQWPLRTQCALPGQHIFTALSSADMEPGNHTFAAWAQRSPDLHFHQDERHFLLAEVHYGTRRAEQFASPRENMPIEVVPSVRAMETRRYSRANGREYACEEPARERQGERIQGAAAAAAAATTTTTTTTTTTAHCAILLYGLPRSFKSLALPTIVENILKPNAAKGCDYFVHYHYVEVEREGRFNLGGRIYPEDVRLLETAAKAANESSQVWYVKETGASFERKNRDLLRRIFHEVDERGDPLYLPWKMKSFPNSSVENVVKMWSGLDEVWKLMVAHAQEFGKCYVRVGVFRLDMVFRDPINIFTLPNGTVDAANTWAVIPGTERFPVNDRGIYGPFEAVEIWAAKRYERVHSHVAAMARSSKPGLGIHSETFLHLDLLPAVRAKGFIVAQNPDTFCMYRARAGDLFYLYRDCDGVRWGASDKAVVESIIGRACTLVEGTAFAHCPPSGRWNPKPEGRHLIVNVAAKDVTAGWGNHFGRLLFTATIARCFGAVAFDVLPDVSTLEETAMFVHGKYSLSAFQDSVNLPRDLRVFGKDADMYGAAGAWKDDPRGAWRISTEAPADLIRFDFTGADGNMVAVNYHLPETAFDFWRRTCESGLDTSMPLKLCGAQLPSREAFLATYRTVQREVSPRRDLCNPPPRTYMALHLRRGDKGTTDMADAYRAIALVSAKLKEKRLGGRDGHATAALLPWLVVSDDLKLAEATKIKLRKLGLAVLNSSLPSSSSSPSRGGGCSAVHSYTLSEFPTAATFDRSTNQSKNVSNSSSGSSSEDVTHSKSTASASTAREKAEVEENTNAALRDFFALRGALGVIVSVPAFDESSFSTVAASLGDVPLLFCFARARHLSATPVWFEREGNNDEAIRGFYFAEHVDDFVEALLDPTHRHQTDHSRSRKANRGGSLVASEDRGWPASWDERRLTAQGPANQLRVFDDPTPLRLPCMLAGTQQLSLLGGVELQIQVDLRAVGSSQSGARAALYTSLIGACEEAAKERPARILTNHMILRFCEDEPAMTAAVIAMTELEAPFCDQ